jgi:hypothetical protein
MLLALLSSDGKMIHKKTVTGNHEELIDRARNLLQSMEEQDAMYHLKNSGIKPEIAYMVVKAAKILAEPYVFKEHKDRIVKSDEL